MGCKQCQQVWGLFLERHFFRDVGFFLAGVDLGRKLMALGRAREVFKVFLPVEDFKVFICHLLGGFGSALLGFVV